MFKTIKSKFVSVTVLFILLSVGIPTTFLIYQFRENFRERSYIMIETTIDVIINGINRSMLTDKKNIQEIITQYANNDYLSHIRILSADGTILYSSQLNDIKKNIKEVSPDHHLSENLYHRKLEISGLNNSYVITQPILNLPACQQCHKTGNTIAYLDIDTNLSPSETRFYTGSSHMIYLAVAIIIILFTGFILFFYVFIDKPVKKVIGALDEIQTGNLNTKISYKSEDEFGALANHFNKMTAHIKESRDELDSMHFEQLKRADKLVTLGELSAEMAHEINNPTAVIMSRADYLQMESEDNISLKTYSEDFEVIINQAAKISRITANILKYSKQRAKEFQKINMIRIIQETLNIFEPLFVKKGITVHQNIRCKNCAILGDSSQCEQVITNILNNAVDAIGTNGNITISLKPGGGEDFCLLTIHDDGPGMDEHTRKQIFSPFFTTKSADKGTGLGLYIVKNICHNHDSEISCESKLGEGTTFSIKFKKMKNES